MVTKLALLPVSSELRTWAKRMSFGHVLIQYCVIYNCTFTADVSESCCYFRFIFTSVRASRELPRLDTPAMVFEPSVLFSLLYTTGFRNIFANNRWYVMKMNRLVYENRVVFFLYQVQKNLYTRVNISLKIRSRYNSNLRKIDKLRPKCPTEKEIIPVQLTVFTEWIDVQSL